MSKAVSDNAFSKTPRDYRLATLAVKQEALELPELLNIEVLHPHAKFI